VFFTVPLMVCGLSPGYMSLITLVWASTRLAAPAEVAASPVPEPLLLQNA